MEYKSNISRKRIIIYMISILMLFVPGCGDDMADEQVIEEEEQAFHLDSASSMIQVGNVMFCIPSPVQTAFLLKDVGANYTTEMLNPRDNVSNYSTNFKKGLNMGIYGADLGYCVIYDQSQDALHYLKAVESLANELGVASAFSPELVKRLVKNIGIRDSLLGLVSTAYREANAFLQDNDRQDVCALILAGGWVESLYFVTQISGTLDKKELVNRIGEQKNTLNNLIKLLEPHYNDNQEFTELIDQLYDLATDFDGVQINYTYEKPTIETEKKLLTVNSVSEVAISAEQISSVTDKIMAIREHIID